MKREIRGSYPKFHGSIEFLENVCKFNRINVGGGGVFDDLAFITANTINEVTEFS